MGGQEQLEKALCSPRTELMGTFLLPWEGNLPLNIWVTIAHLKCFSMSLLPSSSFRWTPGWLPLGALRLGPVALQRRIHPGLIHAGPAWSSPVSCGVIGAPLGSRAPIPCEVILLLRFLLCKTCSRLTAMQVSVPTEAMPSMCTNGSKVYSRLNFHFLLHCPWPWSFKLDKPTSLYTHLYPIILCCSCVNCLRMEASRHWDEELGVPFIRPHLPSAGGRGHMLHWVNHMSSCCVTGWCRHSHIGSTPKLSSRLALVTTEKGPSSPAAPRKGLTFTPNALRNEDPQAGQAQVLSQQSSCLWLPAWHSSLSTGQPQHPPHPRALHPDQPRHPVSTQRPRRPPHALLLRQEAKLSRHHAKDFILINLLNMHNNPGRK